MSNNEAPDLGPSIAARIRELMGSQTTAAFARKCGLGESLIRTYLAGSMPGADKAAKIADANGVELRWLVTGVGPRSSTTVGVRESPAEYEVGGEWAFHLVPRYNVDASAGGGAVVERESEIGRLAFRKDWIRSKGLTPANLVVVRAAGDSMEPTIRDGSLLLVDTAQSTVAKDGIYVLMIDGHLVTKRLQIDLGGGVYIRSDNPAYSDQRLSGEQLEAVTIVGRVIWAGGEI